MVNHMTSLGFDVQTEQDFEGLAAASLQYGTKIHTAKGTYVYYEANDGIELWLQLNKRNEVIGLNPHFNGKSNIRVGITAEVIRKSDSALDGAFHGWADPDPGGESGVYPFVFDVPNRAQVEKLSLPQILPVQLAAFSHELSVYDNEEDFSASQDTEFKLAPEAFIPSGLFGETEEPGATAIFSGKVLETRDIINEHTVSAFSWALVKTLGGEIDVVTDKKLLAKDITAGSIVSGSFWLSGRFLQAPQIKKQSLASRMFRFR